MSYYMYLSVKLVYGSLYPAYHSFKAVKERDVRKYVHWMTYWIVLASWTILEEIVDIFFVLFFPFYYQLNSFYPLACEPHYTRIKLNL